MSYILDALRKSEEDRHQGRVPTLGTQANLIRPPEKKSSIVPILLGLIILINGLAVIYWLFFTGNQERDVSTTPLPLSSGVEAALPGNNQAQSVRQSVAPPVVPPVALPPLAAPTMSRPPAISVPTPAATQQTITKPIVDKPVVTAPVVVAPAVSPSTPAPKLDQHEKTPAPVVRQSVNRSKVAPKVNTPPPVADPYADVPYVSELDESLQRRLPDLHFNSHIYAESPNARRAMINNIYLREGQRFSGVKLEAITEEGVVLNKNGLRFKLPALKDWTHP